MLRDLRHALRNIRRSPGAYISCVLLIALGVAANTQIFAFIDAILLRPLPVPDPQSLVQLFDIHPPFAPQRYFDSALLRIIQERSTTLHAAVGEMETAGRAEHEAVAERVHFNQVTGNYFADLGIKPAFGRMIVPGDKEAAVLSDAYWRRSFGSDPAVLGRTIHIFRRAFIIVGVAPHAFVGTAVDAGSDLWIAQEGGYNIRDTPGRVVDASYRDSSPVEIIARLRPGVTLQQAQAEVAGIIDGYNRELILRDPSRKAFLEGSRVEVRSAEHGLSPLRDQSATALWILCAGAGLLLLMVAANVGGLLLARANLREKETAVRLALGASRSQVARMWVLESLLVTAVGGALGIAVAYIGLPLAANWLPPARGIGFDPAELRVRALELSPDARVIAASLLICAMVAFLASLAPALHTSRHDLWSALKIAIGGNRRHRLFQSILCFTQVAVCTAILIFGGWMLRSLTLLRTADSGFSAERIAVFSIDPYTAGYDAAQTESLLRRMLDGAPAIPGVEAAAWATRPLMHGIGLVGFIVFPGRTATEPMSASTNTVSPGYFETLGMHIVEGRDLFAVPREQKIKPVVVNRAFAERYLPGRSALGELFSNGRKWVAPEFEIVGVVNNTKYRSLREVPPPIYYKADFGIAPQFDRFALHVRTKGQPAAVAPAMRQLLASIDPRISFHETATLSEEIDRSLWLERALAALASAFGVFAFLLTLVGLYGIVDHFVTQRRREIALRLALGAPAASLGRLVARQFVVILAAGLVCGATIAFGCSRWAASLFYQITRLDPVSITSALALMAAVALLAGARPLWNALHVDPASTLRQE